ncbi:MAG: hypothetical protein HOP02_10215 [Methylococcaceae bacterium]|nr:hypothetical protein [Methylococcaceae bacterium]
MKRLTVAIALGGILWMLNGCVAYAPPFAYPGAYYGNAPYPYGGYGYGYQPYGYIRVVPRFYGGFRGG